MAKKKTLQTNFSAGELGPELGMRQDTEQYRNGAKSLRNMRCLIGGGVTRRPGSRKLAVLTQDSIVIEFIVDRATMFNLCFSTGRVDIFLPDGTAVTSITGAPWTGTIWQNMTTEQRGNTMFLVHALMPIQVLARSTAGTWSRSAFSFFVGAGGRTEQPYYKLAPPNWTLAPSALTGAITLQIAGGSFFVTEHIGQIIRYIGREILITGVTDTDTASGTVIELLPGTQTLTVTSSAQFAIGHVVLGDTTAARGEVTGIPDATHLTVVIIDKLTQFAAEDLIGPEGVTTISAVAAATPAAVTDWDEQLIGPAYGYPAVVKLHRNRLCFAGHPAVPTALITSRLGNLYSFDVGDGSDADAIFETIGDAVASEITQLYSAEQLLIATDRGCYYVPESQANPFRPTSMAFLPFGSGWPITRSARMCAFDDGVLMVSGSLVIMARPTGNLTQSWSADEVSLLSSHIITTPTRIAAVSNFNGGPERYAMLVNSDGTIAPTQLVAAQKIRNVTPWDTDGEYRSVSCLLAQVFVTTRRVISGVTKHFLEVFDQAVTLDCAITSTDLTDVVATFGSVTQPYVVVGNASLGTYPLENENPPAGPYTVGLYYDTRTEPLPPAIEDNEGPHAGELMRIMECYVHVLASARFAQNGYELAAYQVTDDPTIAPPLRTGPERFQFQGWAVDPTVPITQPDPLPLTVLAMKSVVAY